MEFERTKDEVIDRNPDGEIMVATVSMDQLTTPYHSNCTGFPANTGTLMSPQMGVDRSSVEIDIFADMLVPTEDVPYSSSDLPVDQPASHDSYDSADFPANTGTLTGPHPSVDCSSVGVNIFDVLVPTADVPYSNTYSSADPQQSVGPSPYDFMGHPADSGTSNGAQSTGDPSSIGRKWSSSQPVTNHPYLGHIVNP